MLDGWSVSVGASAQEESGFPVCGYGGEERSLCVCFGARGGV